MKGFALLLALLPLAASAATITVNSTADNTTAGNGQCTLREAIANVNAAADTSGGDCTPGSGAGDTIIFNLTLPAVVRLAPTRGELAIGKDVSIVGPGAGSLAIDGRKQTRVFHITAGSASMSDVTIRNGLSGFRSTAKGGGILLDAGATLELTNCRLLANKATNIASNINGGSAAGGGINVAGALTLTNCTLSGNQAISRGDRHADGYAAGGGIVVETNATATLTNCTLSGNKVLGTVEVNDGNGGNGVGGAIEILGTATLTNCTLRGNRATGTGLSFAGGGIGAGGAIDVECTQLPNGECSGGAATLTNCTLSGNKAIGTGGGDAYGGGIEIFGGSGTLTDCTLNGNQAAGGDQGGGSGGGVDTNNGSGAVTFTNSTFSGNKAIGYSLGNGSIGTGGGLDIESDSPVTLTNCTFSGNQAIGYGSGDGYAAGGPFGLGGGIEIDGTATLTNCTLSGNTVRGGADGGESGGGIEVQGSAMLTNCTLSGNTATGYGSGPFNGGGGIDVAGAATLTNTIVSNSGQAGNCGNPLTSGGHNLDSDGTCFTSGGTDLLNTNPRLAPLANYGGPTDTLALCTAPGLPKRSCKAASPAIDAGDDTVTGAPDNLGTDQRGLSRLSGAHVDIGAYEVQ